jgi:hypothetical protein
VHDKTILEEESKTERLLDGTKKLVDLAFLGIGNEYNNVYMPVKKPKGKELTSMQKEKNKKLSRTRVKIENAFAGVKRLRVVAYTSRAKRDTFINMIFLLACGIWNFYLYAK